MKGKYFSEAELHCKCGCGAYPSQEFVDRLDRLRETLGFALKLNSCARCETHNKAIGGGIDSQHLVSRHKGAGDVACTDSSIRYKILKAALALGFTGIGLHKNFIHVDIRSTLSVAWFY